ncbi:hypothetical protein JCM17844_08240 [Iodidimonas gelatinilytica]|uniref:histidine kinase n=1 Tax=Iodidimonas gelatinilytica TaxID=1236966 RepID=A0A5A7MML5_9PROT|nr:PAS domain-containing protein [Iodidimonas gelatinilytica]GEQ97187.1 hypothetical protein JCM17844_08240 [Iodidimonas gelatinilytica]
MTTGQLESKSDAGLTALPASSACAQLCRSAEIICPSVILIGIDIEGHILWMNEQARAVLYGLPPTHKTDTIFQLIETVDHPALTSNLRTLVRTCVNAVQIAFHLKTPMGKAPYLRGHIITTPKNPDGTDTYVISVHAVTPYSSEDDHFHKIIHQALEATIVHRDGKVLYANQKSADIFGVEDHQKMLDIPDFHSFIHPHDKDLFEQRDNHTKSEGISSEEFECRLISEKEKITWVRCRIGTIMWNGRPATVTTFIDITDKKSEEHAQREREKLFTRILEISPDVVAISDCESGEYLWVNTAFSKFFGIPAKEVYGRTSLELGIWHSLNNGHSFWKF